MRLGRVNDGAAEGDVVNSRQLENRVRRTAGEVKNTNRDNKPDQPKETV